MIVSWSNACRCIGCARGIGGNFRGGFDDDGCGAAEDDRVRANCCREATYDLRGTSLKFACGLMRATYELMDSWIALQKFACRIRTVPSRRLTDGCELMKVASAPMKIAGGP